MKSIRIEDEDLHAHLRSRMSQRGVSREEIEITLNQGRQAVDVKPGTEGKIFIFSYKTEWEGRFYEEKEVTVYYKVRKGKISDVEYRYKDITNVRLSGVESRIE